MSKAVIMAGGLGSRMGALDLSKPPKPLVTLADRPVILHVADLLRRAGAHEIIVATGARSSEVAAICAPEADMKAVFTGDDCENAERLRRLAPMLAADQPILMAWCDGLTDAPLEMLVQNLRKTGAAMSMLAVNPPERFGLLELDGDKVSAFREKRPDQARWINAGFFALSAGFAQSLPAGASLERDIFPQLAQSGEIAVCRHRGFWQCMDNQLEAEALDRLARSGQAPWIAARSPRLGAFADPADYEVAS